MQPSPFRIIEGVDSHPTLGYDGSLCGECYYCCWAFGVRVPSQLLFGDALKLAGAYCWWLRGPDCSIHSADDYPQACRSYICPHLIQKTVARARDSGPLVRMPDGSAAWPSHKPGLFLAALRKICPIGMSVMPHIPESLPSSHAIDLIQETRALPAARPGAYLDGGRVGYWLVGLCLLPEADPALALERWNSALNALGEVRPYAAAKGLADMAQTGL